MKCKSILSVYAAALLVGCLGEVTGPVAKTDEAGTPLDRSVLDASRSAVGGEKDAAGAAAVDPPRVGGGDAGAAPPDASTASQRDSGPTSTPPIVQVPPAPKVNDCKGLAAEGVFEDITPPEVRAGLGVARDGGGTFAIAVDPVNQGTIYAGSIFAKVWKSVDCGATWTHITTGRNGKALDEGMNWTFAIDPQDPQVLYTNSGYTSGIAGLYKSLNGGVDWDLVWPPPSQPELAKAFQYNFANVIDIDPANHLHILLTFHEKCLAPHPGTCIAESTNGGTTWRLIDGQPGWDGGEGQVIFFMNDSKTWLWGSQSNGFWRSGDSGNSWEVIKGMTTSHYQGSQLLRLSNGGFFMAGGDGIWRTPDGLASTWTLVKDTGPTVGGLVTNGTTMFASTCYAQNACPSARYLRSPVTDGQNWTDMKAPTIKQGGTMGYDKGHSLLYSSNMQGGLWRVVAR